VKQRRARASRAFFPTGWNASKRSISAGFHTLKPPAFLGFNSGTRAAGLPDTHLRLASTRGKSS
jgi:hypothetical protein